MTSTDSVALQARIWPSDKMTYHFAEQDQGILPATPNTGVCFSGDRRPETDGSGLPGGYCHPKPFTSPF